MSITEETQMVESSTSSVNWDDLRTRAAHAATSRSKEYRDRLTFEFNEIEKQGASDYWVDLVKSGKKFDENLNGLVFPLLLGITGVDPVEQKIDHNIEPRQIRH